MMFPVPCPGATPEAQRGARKQPKLLAVEIKETANVSRPRGSSHQPFPSHCSSDTCELTGQQSRAALGWAGKTRPELSWAGLGWHLGPSWQL